MFDRLNDDQYGLLFDVRRSARYHDRRVSFFTTMHKLTGVLTVLLSGSIIFDIARPGDNPWWLLSIAVGGAALATIDFVVGYASCATAHRELMMRWSELEIEILKGPSDETAWEKYRLDRLLIEKDEPPIYRALDLLCHNELLVVDKHCESGEKPSNWARITSFQRWTSQLYRWPNIVAS